MTSVSTCACWDLRCYCRFWLERWPDSCRRCGHRALSSRRRSGAGDNRSVGSGERVRSTPARLRGRSQRRPVDWRRAARAEFHHAGQRRSGIRRAERADRDGSISTAPHRHPSVARNWSPSLMGRLRSMPTIVAAGAGNMAPLGESSFVSGFAFGHTDAGQQIVARALQYVDHVRVCRSPEPARQGRASDRSGGRVVADRSDARQRGVRCVPTSPMDARSLDVNTRGCSANLT